MWKSLATRDKVFDKGQFDPKALLHNLRDQDYGRTLSDLRAAFYSAPRLPLLFAGDRDLQEAIYDAAETGLVDIVDGSGGRVVVTAPGQVNLTSAGLRLAKPQPKTCDHCGQSAHTGCCPTAQPGGAAGSAATTTPQGGATADTATGTAGGQPGNDPQAATAATEKHAAFSFTSNLLANPENADVFAALFKTLYMALDERQISYLQGTLQLVLDADTANGLQQNMDELGISGTIKDI